MHNKILEIKNFSKTYPGGKRAVDGLSLDIFEDYYPSRGFGDIAV